MAASDNPTPPLPARASAEHLRKQAKRRARDESIQLAAAQRRIAQDHGFASWAALMRAVADRQRPSPLSEAAARADEAQVRALIAAGAAVDGADHEVDTPLYRVCDSAAPPGNRLAVAGLLIAAGAFTRCGCTRGATPLHAAARRGPAALVELLIRNGALFWQEDAKGRRPHDEARDGAPIDRDRILSLTADGPRIEDPVFRDAIAAIQSGDAATLGALLDAHPHLLRERAVEPDVHPRGYFSDPMLFWFIANNPTLVPDSPPNIVDIARLMIARGVDSADLDYALELVMTNGLMPEETQIALVETLHDAGAQAGRKAILMTLGHVQTAPVAWLIDHGLPIAAASAAGLGRIDALARLLGEASFEARQDALAMAVINGHYEAARLCLEAGADPNRFMPCHSHSTPLHQAAGDGGVEMMKLLVAHGARPDIEDTLWHGTPLGWARHGGQKAAEIYLLSLAPGAAPDAAGYS